MYPSRVLALMLLIPADRSDGWIGLENGECIIRICFCFLASISSDWARWRDREGESGAQHAASLHRNPFIALMSVKMPDESDDKRGANEFPPGVLGVDQDTLLLACDV